MTSPQSISSRYQYRFIDGTGNERLDAVDASSRSEALHKIKRMGRIAVSVSEPGATDGQRNGKISAQIVAVFAGQLSRLLESRVPIERALAIVAQDGKVGAAANAIRSRLLAGLPPSAACSASPELFDAPSIALVRAGESSGDLAGAFAEIERLATKSGAIRDKIRSAMIYPAILAVVAMAAVLLILLHVIPQFESLMADHAGPLPLASRLVFGLSATLRSVDWLIGAALVAAALVAVRAYKSGRLEAGALALFAKAPVLSAAQADIEPARAARLIGVLVSRSVPLLTAVEIARSAAEDPSMRTSLNSVRSKLQEGGSLHAAIRASEKFPRLLADLVQVGEETGGLGPMLVKAADILDERIDRTLQRFLILFQPMLLVVIGLLIGGLLYGLFSAILSVNQTII
jgi:general secretion pathway protein F